ncbi:unnamed protein product [Thelazia callipaeda]|uniref:DUF4817 domain-containing protein n=1 Tax=Thelazia callipaeda TaxID=103827 RepID=A0A0N5CR83_THECL|nr:unnamed protein product [Thelazia callipaeda]
MPIYCRLKSVQNFFVKHKFAPYPNLRPSLNVFSKYPSKLLQFDDNPSREMRRIASLRRNYANVHIQAKNMLFIHYLIKRIVSTHSVRIRLDDLRSAEFGLSNKGSSRSDRSFTGLRRSLPTRTTTSTTTSIEKAVKSKQ